MKTEGLSKKEILSSKEEIKKLFDEKNVLKKYPLVIYWKVNNEPNHRIVVSVPKRNFKKAVDRNRIKRQLREIWRRQKLLIGSSSDTKYDLFIIFTGKEEFDYKKLESKFVLLLNELK